MALKTKFYIVRPLSSASDDLIFNHFSKLIEKEQEAIGTAGECIAIIVNLRDINIFNVQFSFLLSDYAMRVYSVKDKMMHAFNKDIFTKIIDNIIESKNYTDINFVNAIKNDLTNFISKLKDDIIYVKDKFNNYFTKEEINNKLFLIEKENNNKFNEIEVSIKNSNSKSPELSYDKEQLKFDIIKVVADYYTQDLEIIKTIKNDSLLASLRSILASKNQQLADAIDSKKIEINVKILEV